MAQTPDSKQIVTTYALLTAENILFSLGITLPKMDRELLIKNKEAFYHRLLMPLCQHIINQHILDYCEELEDFGQNELTNMQGAYSSYCRFHEIESPEATSTGRSISEAEERLSTLRFRRHRMENNQNQTLLKITQELKKWIAEWQILQSENAKQLTQALIDEGTDLPNNFEEKLKQRLITQLIDLPSIPSEAIKRFKLKKREATTVEKALISLLYEDKKS